MADKKAAKKRLHSQAELDNDPSLAICPYRPYEAIWSDSHQVELRFVRYEGDEVVLAELNSMAELEGVFPLLSIRRLTAK